MNPRTGRARRIGTTNHELTQNRNLGYPLGGLMKFEKKCLYTALIVSMLFGYVFAV